MRGAKNKALFSRASIIPVFQPVNKMRHTLGNIVLLILILLPTAGAAQLSIERRTSWGAVSNGICLGIDSWPRQWPGRADIGCGIDLENVTTNFLWTWFPKFEDRYQMELRGPDGQKVRQVRPILWAQKVLWGGVKPHSTNAESASLDWFYLRDTFEMRTNGEYTLVVSMQVNAFTNFMVGHSKMRKKPEYFLLPPVTNKFNVSFIPPDTQTNATVK